MSQIISKFKSPPTAVKTTRTSGDNQHRTAESAYAGLMFLVKTTKEASPAFPPLQSALGGLLSVLEYTQKGLFSNPGDMQELSDHMRKLESILSDIDHSSYPPKFIESVSDLAESITKITNEMQQMTGKNALARTLNAERHAGIIQSQIKALSSCIELFTVNNIFVSASTLHGHGESLHRHGESLQQIKKNTSLIINTLAGPVPRHASARYDQHDQRVVCEDETRLETLATVYRWLKPDDPRLETLPEALQDTSQVQVFWLNGLAGTGKSTIAQTVAYWCYDETPAKNFLGASFFCSRDSEERSDASMVFSTISYQLCFFNRDFQKEVADIPDHTSLAYANVATQLQRLIVEPLRAVKARADFPPCVVIIDALDECKDGDTVTNILRALSRYIPGNELAPLKFLITSRPVHSVRGGFLETGLIKQTQKLVLHEISPELTDRDIERYLIKKLDAVARRCNISRPWPSQEKINSLVKKASGLFIFAATAVKFLDAEEEMHPEEQLTLLLESTEAVISRDSPYKHLDALYLQVLGAEFSKRKVHLRRKMVLGTLILIRDRLSPTSLEKLMGLDAGVVRATLKHLHSLVAVPDSSDTQVIRLIHPSFRDFIVDRSRCHDADVAVDARIQHKVIAKRCLDVMMKSLRRDICFIGDPSKLNIDVPDLIARVHKYIPPHLQYACRHWAFHVHYADFDDELVNTLHNFCSKSLLNWLEVLSLLGGFFNAINGLSSARKTLEKQSHPPSSDIVALLSDCEHVIRQFFPVLSVSCLQIYCGIVPFCPTTTPFYELYSDQGPETLTLLTGSVQHWSPCLQVLEGHSDMVLTVAFSPDGDRIASGAKDNTICLWDVTTALYSAPYSITLGRRL
ncbi:hypothetical protein EW146_g8640, partial [Bondarzewia mesenterica]